jgi:hypothetical protein
MSDSGRAVAHATWQSFREAYLSNIYYGNSIVGGTSGYPLAWISDNELIVQRYRASTSPLTRYEWDSTVVVDRDGKDVRTGLPRFNTGLIENLRGGTLLYDGEIKSSATGAVLWTSPHRGSPPLNAVSDTHVLYLHGAKIRLTTY